MGSVELSPSSPFPFPRGPLNWYRNMRPNWRWALSAKDRKVGTGIPFMGAMYGATTTQISVTRVPVCPLQILMPALMVTAGKDVVLLPSMSKGMEEWVRMAPSQSRWVGDASMGAPMGVELWGWELCWDMGWGVGCGV